MSQLPAPDRLHVCKEGIADIDSGPEKRPSLPAPADEAGKAELKAKFVELRAKGLS